MIFIGTVRMMHTRVYAQNDVLHEADTDVWHDTCYCCAVARSLQKVESKVKLSCR